MVAIPKPEITMIDKIYAAIEKKLTRPFRLTRIGASGIGNPCLRAIWYDWRGYDSVKFDGRMRRLFETGEHQEVRIQQDLQLAGYQVWTHDDEGNQFTATDETGHFVCKLDGVIKGVNGAEKTPHDLEIKTHSFKSFDEVQKKGVEKAKPMHFYQMQAGMIYHKLPRALYVALNKNNEAYHIERIYPDETVQRDVKTKITKLVEARMIPVGISPDGNNFDCKWCDMRGVCVEGKKPIKTCRSCEHAEPQPQNGEWLCTHRGHVMTSQEQLEACPDYEVKTC